jgi:hypothetical protein
MTWRSDHARPGGRRSTASPAAKRADRERAEAAGLQMLERASRLRMEKTARLKKLREANDLAKKQ